MKSNESKTILIARVSDPEQRKALPAQKLRLENYAKHERGLEQDDWQYEEFDESAYKEARQKFSELIVKFQSMDELLIVVFDKIDRFTRDASQKEVRIMSKLVEEGKIELHFPSDNLFIDKDSPATDLFRLGIGMLLAKYYSDSSRDNVKRRFQQMLNDGIWVHRAPIGYININKGTEKNPDKDIIKNDDTAHYVVKAFELRAEGKPYAVIAKELGEMGFKSGRSDKPSKAFLERILKNKFYYGVMTHSGKDYPHKYEPLISRALYSQVQRVRDERKHDKTKYDSIDYTFKKITKCGKCGRAVSSFRSRNTVYLRCASNGQCGNENTAEALVVENVARDVSNFDIPEPWLNKIIGELRKRHDNQQLYFTQNIVQARKEYDSITKQIEKNYKYLLAGSITQPLHDKTANELEARQQELNDMLKSLTSDNKSFALTSSYLLDLAQRAEELFVASDEGLRNKLLEYVLSNIELKDKKLSYMFNQPFRTIIETKKKSLVGSNSNIWCG